MKEKARNIHDTCCSIYVYSVVGVEMNCVDLPLGSLFSGEPWAVRFSVSLSCRGMPLEVRPFSGSFLPCLREARE